MFGEFPGYEQDLFLAQKIKVGVTAGTRIDDGGKVPGNIVGVTTIVSQRECKGDFQGDLGCPDDVTVSPRLTENRDFHREKQLHTGTTCHRGKSHTGRHGAQEAMRCISARRWRPRRFQPFLPTI